MITPSHPSSRDEPIVRNSCRQEVIERTTGEIRTFLSALSNGTSHYKSLHNLTEQIGISGGPSGPVLQAGYTAERSGSIANENGIY